jgi:cysteine desulfurase
VATPKLPVYLDYHATTPVDPRVLTAMLPYFREHFGNAASKSHAFGWKAEAAVTDGREALADFVGANPKEIIFTSGATESNNLAILGAARGMRSKGDHVVTSAIEHRAILDPCRQLEMEGFRVTYLKPDRFGVTSMGAVAAALTDKTILVSLMVANNEIGTLNPIEETGRLCKDRRVVLHTDAVQALGKIPLDVNALGVDLMSVTAHKLCGPKGAGALYVRSSNPRVKLHPILFGGGHERGLRSGTLNVPGIVGFGAAARIAAREMEEERARVGALRDRLHEGLARLPGVILNGHPTDRLAGNLNLCFAGVTSDAFMMEVRDIAVSSGSACTSASIEPSHVLAGIGLSPQAAHSSIRFGLGRFTTPDEVDFAIAKVSEAVKRLREKSPALTSSRP